MKKFLSGVLCATLVFSLTLSALAISGKMTIEVDPINIMVNGEVFVPKDVNGKEVPQFAYQGTTYAPLRALAEAYGLEVGYDAAANMATVQDPDAPVVPAEDTKAEFHYVPQSTDTKYLDFMNMWNVELSSDCEWLFVTAKDINTTVKWWEDNGKEAAHDHLWTLADELAKQFNNEPPTIIVLGSKAVDDESFFHPYGHVIVPQYTWMH